MTDRDAILDVQRWTAQSLKEQGEILRRRPRGSVDRTGHFRPADAKISPLDLYAYLKARFGPPNDIIMMARGPGLENLVHWGYALSAQGHGFNIHSTSRRLEFIGISLTPADWRILAANIKADFGVVGDGMRDVRSGLEQWTLFINPFKRIQTTVISLAAHLEALSIEEPGPHPMVMTSEEAEQYHKDFRRWMGSTRIAATAGTSVRMLAPVWAEAFVNFLLFVLGRPDVRRDVRLYEGLLRQPIDVRVRGLHLNCVDFKEPIDSSHQAFASFLTLMNGRNDFLHGNIDPHRLAFDELFVDKFGSNQTIPLFKDDRSNIARFLANSLKFVEPSVALSDLEIVAEFVTLVLSQLTDESAQLVRRLLQQDYLRFNRATGEISQFVDDAIGEGVLVAPAPKIKAKGPKRPRKPSASKR